MSDNELLQRIGDLISATNVESVMEQLGQWLINSADITERIGRDKATCDHYRAIGAKLFALAEEFKG